MASRRRSRPAVARAAAPTSAAASSSRSRRSRSRSRSSTSAARRSRSARSPSAWSASTSCSRCSSGCARCASPASSASPAWWPPRRSATTAACCSRSWPSCPCCSCSRWRARCASGSRSASPRPMLGVYWIGLALANAVLLRGLDHGGALVFMVLLGTFVGDTGAYLGGRAFGTPPAGAARVAQQDVGGPGHRDARLHRLGLVRQPHLRRQLDRRHRRAAAGRRGRDRGAARRPLRVADQARRRDEGHRRPVRRPRRRARPARRRAVLADRRLPGLAGAEHERRRGEARPPDDRAAQRAARRAARGADPVRVPAHRARSPSASRS